MNLSRREMLRVGLGGIGAMALGATAPAALGQITGAGFFRSRDQASGKILVVVQLTGGNDGLNTVIATGHDAYEKARPTLALRTNLLRLNDELSLHPAMTGLKALYDDGRLAIVNGCGYERPNRSHFHAMEIWHTGQVTQSAADGWLAKLAGNAMNVGCELPQALASQEWIVPSIQGTNGPYRSAAEYPGGLGQSLRAVAQRISSGASTRVFYCQISGFDTHANQLAQHERLLENVSSSIAAFQQDLAAKKLDDRVALMCFSEFGRRLGENSSGGTDHGTAGPMFIVGTQIKGGLYGKYPLLDSLDDGDLRHTTDFRSVYSTLLDRWLSADVAAALGEEYPRLAFA